MQEQCKGITRSGERCKNSRNLKDGYCYLHVNQASAADVVEKKNKSEVTPQAPAAGSSQSLKFKHMISLFLVIVAGVFFLSLSKKKSSVR